MLSYQHSYHAGNLADVHKHSLLAWVLAYMVRKDKPLSYIETHAGRGLYDLGDADAMITGEAAKGIAIAESWFSPDHPYRQCLANTRQSQGDQAYPGSPLIAAHRLRPMDNIYLAELHPGEHDALRAAMAPHGAILYKQDGWQLAMSLAPPDPARGLMLIDPSYEVKGDYAAIPAFMAKLHRKWAVGVIMLWYPILTNGAHRPMVAALKAAVPGVVQEVRFAPARPGHGMVGSGLFVVNPPYGFDIEAAKITRAFAAAHPGPM